MTTPATTVVVTTPPAVETPTEAEVKSVEQSQSETVALAREVGELAVRVEQAETKATEAEAAASAAMSGQVTAVEIATQAERKAEAAASVAVAAVEVVTEETEAEPVTAVVVDTTPPAKEKSSAGAGVGAMLKAILFR